VDVDQREKRIGVDYYMAWWDVELTFHNRVVVEA
jgi:hypothetical protein